VGVLLPVTPAVVSLPSHDGFIYGMLVGRLLMHPAMPVMAGEVTRRIALRGDDLLRTSIGMTENRRVTRTGVN
jgi:hypothetical protein